MCNSEIMEPTERCESEFKFALVKIKQENSDENLPAPDAIQFEQNGVNIFIKSENYWEEELVLDWNENHNVTGEIKEFSGEIKKLDDLKNEDILEPKLLPQKPKMTERKTNERTKRFKIYCAKCNKVDGWKDRDSICVDCNIPLSYQCHICYETRPSSGKIWHHVRKIHPKVYNYLCPGCDFASEKENLVLNHVKKSHPILKSYKIKKLDLGRMNEKKELNQNKNLSEAQANRSAMLQRLQKLSVYFCVKCSKESEIYRPSEKKYCRDCQSALVFKCLKCDRHCQSEKAISYHLLTVCDPQELYQCSQCNYSSRIQKYVTRHYKSMHDSETYVCEKCNRICKNLQNFKVHKQRYCGLKFSFHCDHCPFYSENKKVLRKHILKEHVKQIRFACHKCNTTYKHRHSLDYHLTHCGKKPQFKCEQCCFKTRYGFELNRHVRRIHSANGKKKMLEIPRVRHVIDVDHQSKPFTGR